VAHSAVRILPSAGWRGSAASLLRAGLLLASLLGMLGASVCNADTPQPSAPGRGIHALVIGIDHYRFSTARQSGAAFPDLAGAVGDANRFAQALTELYGVTFTPPDKSCGAAPIVSVVLTDACATRERILKRLDDAIAMLKPGDTLLLYFAGHGARYRDDEHYEQDTGFNGTILPYDARNPDGSPGDIFDVELKARKDRATAAGIYFVSIFDSCNSATGTREGAAGQSRSAPQPRGTPPAAVASPPVRNPGGYWVHMGAAQDGEEAQETPSGAVGARAGVFTTALIAALHMPGMRDATFGDMIREVRLRVAGQGHNAQTPSAEGRLTAAMGSSARAATLFAVAGDATGATLQAGAFSGVTSGSRFALYARQVDAIARTARLATAIVVSVDRNSARLKLETAPARLPSAMVAEEIAHFFPASLVGVSNDLPAGKARDAVAAALKSIGFVAVAPRAANHLVLRKGTAATVELRADDGVLLSTALGNAGTPGFADRLTGELRKIARVAQLLALRTAADDAAGARGLGPIDLCVAPDGYRPTSCPGLQHGGVRALAADAYTTVTAINRGSQPVYLYVLAIDPANAVDLVLPKPDETDQKLQPGLPYRRGPITFDTPGTYRFVTIATDQPIRADALMQSGNGAREVGACVSPLERLLCSAAEGTRDPGVSAVGNWSAQVSTVLVGKGAPPK